MPRALPHPLAATALLLALGACRGGGADAAERSLPWTVRDGTWRTDPVWYDGQAERAVYDATRVIYGRDRIYTATAYTDKERVDPATTVKSAGEAGLEVFKHHWSERAPTESYDYDFSTSTYTLCGDLSPYKLTAATQEDCGASFKEVWRTPGGGFAWLESVYLPGTGRRSGELAAGAHFADALTLFLRDYPFDAPAPMRLALIPSQRDNRRRPFEPQAFTVDYAGRETLALPLGSVDAHHLSVRAGDGSEAYELWFAADGSAPWLHALLRYRDGAGTRFELRSLERTAYWLH